MKSWWHTIKGNKYFKIASVRQPKTKTELDNYKRDIYGMYSKKVYIPEDMTLAKIKKNTNVQVIYRKNSTRVDFFIRPTKRTFLYAHPVVMGRKHDKRP